MRIEDTDAARCRKEYLNDMLDSLKWLHIVPDECEDTGPHAPYVQSQRRELYHEVAEQLVEQGHAYYCYTSSMQREGEYDRSSRDLSLEQIEQYKKEKIAPVIRLKLPLEGSISFDDLLLGTVSRKFNDMIVDPIIIKSDGMPTYHLANVVDDHGMDITHVLRSQEWVPSTPAHIYMYEVLGWKPPQYCHLSMVLGEDGQKLSKRNGALSIKEMRALGILPEALINYIVLLGWGYDDSREFFTLKELVKLFQKGKMHKSAAKFSMQKLRWFNAHYIRQQEAGELTKRIMPFVLEAYSLEKTHELESRVTRIVPNIQERMELLEDAVTLLAPLFLSPDVRTAVELVDEAQGELYLKGLRCVQAVLEEKGLEDIDELDQCIRLRAKELKLKLSHVFMPLRIAITGSKVSPPILPLLLSIEKKEVFFRLQQFIENLDKRKAQ